MRRGNKKMNRSSIFKACNRRLAINFKCEHWTVWKVASDAIASRTLSGPTDAETFAHRIQRVFCYFFLIFVCFFLFCRNEFASVVATSNLNARRARNLIDWCVTSYIFDGNETESDSSAVTLANAHCTRTVCVCVCVLGACKGNDERVIKCYNFHLSNYVVDKKKLEWLSCAIKEKFSLVHRPIHVFVVVAAVASRHHCLPHFPSLFHFCRPRVSATEEEKPIIGKWQQRQQEQQREPNRLPVLNPLRIDKNMLPSHRLMAIAFVPFNHWRYGDVW